MRLIDTHCHFDLACFDRDRDEATTRAGNAGVRAIVIPAIGWSGWQAMAELCEQRAGLFPAYGLHPMFVEQHTSEHLHRLWDWAAAHRPVAIGECGLDFYLDGLDPVLQRYFFQGQLEIARDLELPVIIHARKAVEEVILTLRRFKGLRGVMHSFSGSVQQAEILVRMGFYLGFGGPVTWPQAPRIHRLVQTLPLHHLLLETDAPDQPSASHRGERNEPSYLPEIVQTIARLRGQSVDHVAEATTMNAIELFGLPREPSL